ncbi:MAG: HEAT repeat domain-containing protein [Pseudomonadota bacterium]|nr:HEAT repeat domain-containing protein [Pseudomonadota bacterium]
MSWILVAALGAALAGTPSPASAGGIDPGVDAPSALVPAANAALAAPTAHALAGSPVSDATLTALADDAGWRLRARAASALTWRRDPAFAEGVALLAPATTRNGAVRFTDRRLRAPEAAPLLVERLLSGTGASAERAALVEALRLSGGDWSEAAAGLYATETDAAVRAQLVSALQDAEAAVAEPTLTRALADADAGVRAATVRAIGARNDGAGYASAVYASLDDKDPDVRAYAARAVGWLGLTDGWDGVVALLSDPSAEVRLKAVAALERLDAGRAATLPELEALAADPDARVARAVARLLGR